VTELVPTIEPIIDRLCTRLQEASKTGEPVDLKYCFAAVTLDVMNEYCFSKDSKTILQSDFGKRGFDDVDSFLEMSIRASYPTLPNQIMSDAVPRTFTFLGL
jgi:hypothetical protein